MMNRAGWLSILAVGILVAGACSDSESTDGGDGGDAGSTSSNGGTGGATATGGTGGAGGAAMCVAHGAPCAATDTCCDAAGATGECFAFGMGSACTIPCPSDPNACPLGFGCNNQNPPVCKVNP